jgi:hypothetical protein
MDSGCRVRSVSSGPADLGSAAPAGPMPHRSKPIGPSYPRLPPKSSLESDLLPHGNPKSPHYLVDAILLEHFEELVIVAIVDMDADNHRTLRIERLLHDRSDIVGSVDH